MYSTLVLTTFSFSEGRFPIPISIEEKTVVSTYDEKMKISESTLERGFSHEADPLPPTDFRAL
jgi:hypothetical protein